MSKTAEQYLAEAEVALDEAFRIMAYESWRPHGEAYAPNLLEGQTLPTSYVSAEESPSDGGIMEQFYEEHRIKWAFRFAGDALARRI